MVMDKRQQLADLFEKWNFCFNCKISEFAFQKVHFDGSPTADFVFVGEGPGVSEDALGLPFIGPSGKLLREAMEFAGFRPGDWAFTNLTACRPTDTLAGANRKPKPMEIEMCDPRLLSILNIVKPRAIVVVGRVSADWISENYFRRMIAIKHPAYILRQGGRSSEEYKKWVASIKKIKEIK